MPHTGGAVDLALLRGAPKGGRSPTAEAPSSNARPPLRYSVCAIRGRVAHSGIDFINHHRSFETYA